MFCRDPDPYLTIMYDFNRDKEDIIGYEIYKQKNTLRLGVEILMYSM